MLSPEASVPSRWQSLLHGSRYRKPAGKDSRHKPQDILEDSPFRDQLGTYFEMSELISRGKASRTLAMVFWE